jgi:phospholipase A-2-activating protein
MPNGDIVTGCSDGTVRIYSAAEERWASEEDLKKYDELISMQAISRTYDFKSHRRLRSW